MEAIDRDSPIPFYHQLKQILKREIRNGSYGVGDRIPTEAELCQMLGISRTPVRQALTELAEEGILQRHRRRGTFVVDPLRPPQDALERAKLRVTVPDRRWISGLDEAVRGWNQEGHAPFLELDWQLVGLPQLHFRLASAVAAGRAPDISLLDSVRVAEFAAAGFLIPLEEIDPEWVAGTVRGDFFPAMLEGNSYQGQLYGLPAEADVTLLWYRKDILRRERLSPPRTWQELMEVGRRLQEPGVRGRNGLGPYPLAFPGGLRAGETTSYVVMALLHANGGRVFQDGRVVLDTAASREVLAFLKGLVDEGIASSEVALREWDTALREFAVGQAALALGGSYERELIRQASGWTGSAFAERVGFLPMPAGPRGQSASLVGGMSYVIYRQSRQPQLAMRILERAVGVDVMLRLSRESGQNPTRISVTRQLNPATDAFLHEASHLTQLATMRPALPQYPRVSEQLQAMVENVLTGQRDVKQAAAGASEAIRAILGLRSDLPIRA